jgi:hypothetical protein
MEIKLFFKFNIKFKINFKRTNNLEVKIMNYLKIILPSIV